MEVNAGPQIHRMRQNQQQPHLVATGGKDNDLKLWDLQSEAMEPVFKAKNVSLVCSDSAVNYVGKKTKL